MATHQSVKTHRSQNDEITASSQKSSYPVLETRAPSFSSRCARKSRNTNLGGPH